MRALVTGGAGFIGSALVERLLAEGHEVDVVDNLSGGSLANLAQARTHHGAFSFQQMDVRLPDLIEYTARRQPAVIFHLAAQSSVTASVERPVFDADNNVIGSLRVFEAALGARCPKVVVAASGGSLYGSGSDESLPFSEAATPRPSSPYAVAKLAVVEYLRVYRALYGLDFTVLLLANVYGPRQRETSDGGVVSIFGRAFTDGVAPTIFGDGRQTRDFVFVDDAVDAFVRSIDRGSERVLNIGSGHETSIRELYVALARAAKSTLRPGRAPAREGEVLRSALDCSLAARELGWRPFTPLADGIRMVLDSLAKR